MAFGTITGRKATEKSKRAFGGVSVKILNSWIALPLLPPEYFWEVIADTMLILRHDKDGPIGSFIQRKIAEENFKIEWQWVHHFRTGRFDTLEEAVAVVLTKHRLGGIELDGERQVF